MIYVSLREWLLLRLGLMPAARARALLQGQQPALHPQSALRLKGVSAAAVLIGIVGAYAASLIGSGLLDRRGLWDSRAGTASRRAAGSGLPVGHEERRQLVESGFTPEAREEIQRVHDRLQLRYGDDVYRNVFKPRVAEAVLAGYLGELGSGRIQTPRQYLRGLGSGDIARVSDAASRDLGR